ncbi:MAG TPA: alkaline phosphatase D family protein [Candidatus Obscuribacterales bacterium]
MHAPRDQTFPHETLPLILAGPILRRVTPDCFTLWLVGSRALELRLTLTVDRDPFFEGLLEGDQMEVLPVGIRAFVHLIQVLPPGGLPAGKRIGYRLEIETEAGWQALEALMPDILYAGAPPRVPVTAQIRELLHGSCRKPHHPSPDALVAADEMLSGRYAKAEDPPDLLIMTGDQVYVDDLCGPMLLAVHRTIALLGLFGESFPEAVIADSDTLYQSANSLYGRRGLLPGLLAKNRLSRLFTPVMKPIFTSNCCDNHLISFAEVFALYLLSWSPAMWELIELPEGADLPLSPEIQQRFDKEKACLLAFVAGLPRVRRLLAHLPCYMIFDDHDVTDDWNLTAAWEQSAYGHPFSRRIIGNALMAYWFCQGWGNDPAAFGVDFWNRVRSYCHQPDNRNQEALIDGLFRFEGWQFSLPTHPKLVVLDTRTRRWHSESQPDSPSGLMNWEALTEIQQWLLHQQAVILVSPAPMFGVKFVEVLQKLFTLAGRALAVDAENWMAHPGAAGTLLNIFSHGLTPGHFVILSGDVHYSFVYDIVIRHRRRSPQIWQITASGLKNQFPAKILRRLGLLNRLLYHRRSPLNWLTRRKRMLIEPRLAEGKAGRQLVNLSAIGQVRFNPDGAPSEIALLTGSGEQIRFEPDADSPIGPVSY